MRWPDCATPRLTPPPGANGSTQSMNTQIKLAHPFWHRDARTNPSNLQWGDPLKQQSRMARLIVGLKKRRVWKDVSHNCPCKQLHSFLIYEPTLWKKPVFRLKVWLLGMDKQDLLVREKPEMLAKKAKQASTWRTKCTYKLIDMIPLSLSLASWLVAQ